MKLLNIDIFGVENGQIIRFRILPSLLYGDDSFPHGVIPRFAAFRTVQGFQVKQSAHRNYRVKKSESSFHSENGSKSCTENRVVFVSLQHVQRQHTQCEIRCIGGKSRLFFANPFGTKVIETNDRV